MNSALSSLWGFVDKMIKPFEWVALAADDHPRAPALKWVKVINGVMWGCDGYRIHMAPTDGRPSGFYDAETGKAFPVMHPYPHQLLETYFHLAADIPQGEIIERQTINPKSLSISGRVDIQKRFYRDACRGGGIICANFGRSLAMSQRLNLSHAPVITGVNKIGSFLILGMV